MTRISENKITVIIAIAAFFLCTNVIASETGAQNNKPITVIIKENRSFTFSSIEKVEHWGIVVLDSGSQKVILYKVIERIELPDSSFIDEIEYHVPGIQITKDNGSYTLDFKHAKIPILKYQAPHIIDLKYVPLALRLDPVETFEAGLVYSLWPLHAFQHHFSFSTGFPYSADPSYHVMALNYGIGTSIYSTKNFEFLYRIYYHIKVLEKTHGAGSNFEEMGFLSIEPQVLFFPTKRAFPSASIRYYFNNFEINNDKMKLFLIVALNIAIGKKE